MEYFQEQKENSLREIRYHKLVISYKEAGHHLTFLFTLFKMEFNPLRTGCTTISKQLSTANNIFKATTLTSFSFSEGIEKVP